MKIELIACDSTGTRSMATFVKTKDVRIIIDPSTALGPRRYGLPPHDVEVKRLEEHWNTIKKYVKRADVVIITHYHYDHHNPREPEIFKGKKLFIKNPKEKINYSQKRRSSYFLEVLNEIPESVEIADGREMNFDKTFIKISEPVYHGTNPRLGYVLEVYIERGRKSFLYTSDVEGPSLEDQVKFILEMNPKILYVDGPMSYMLGYRYSKKSLEASKENLIKIIRETKVEDLILDHHLLRDLNWRERMKEVFEAGEEHGVRVLCGAEFMRRKVEMLEALRKELYEKGY